MIIPSSRIQSPEDTTLAIWKAHSDSLALIKFLQENPDAIDTIAQKIAAAHKLTQAEKDERQAAIDDVKQAKSALDFLESKCSEMKDQASGVVIQAQKTAQKIIDAAESYKKDQEKQLKKRLDALDEDKISIDTARAEVEARERATKNLEKTQADLEKEKADFEEHKAEWEKDFEIRLEKLSDKEKKSVRK